MLPFLSNILAFIFIIVLRVPFQSQKAPDWWAANDCGPAVAAMFIEYYTGVTYHPFDYYKTMNRWRGGLQSTSLLVDYMEIRGVETVVEWEWTYEELKDTVNHQKKPVIVAVTIPTGGHFVIVVSITDNYVYVHDPLEMKGYDRIPVDTFKNRWYYSWSWQHNTVIVPEDVKEFEFTDPYRIRVLEDVDFTPYLLWMEGIISNESFKYTR